MAINSQNGNTLLTSGSFPPVRVASIGSPLNPATGGLLIVDGIQLVAGDRVLCKDETSAINNGIYAASTGPWVRTSDAAGNQNFFSGMAVTVALGATNGGSTFLCTCTDDPVVVGTSLLTFAVQSTVISAGISINAGLINQLAYYAAAGKTLSGLATANNGVLITSGAGVPSISSTLPAAVQGNITATGTIASGTWNGNVITGTYGGTGVNNGASTITLAGNLVIATNGGTIKFGAASKTLTIDNSLELAGTDSTKFTFPSTNDTVATLAATQTLTGKTYDTGGSGNVFKIGGSTATTPAQIQTILGVGRIAIAARTINFNSANTDTAITFTLPNGVTNYKLEAVHIANASASISTATFGLFSATGGGGTALIAGGTAITVTTASANTNNNAMVTNGSTTESYNFTTLQFRVGTAQGSAATADVILTLIPL